MLRLRPYKSIDSKTIIKWVDDIDTFTKWGGDHFGSFPITASTIDDKYILHNGDCKELDNFYPWVAFNEDGLVGHFIMRYLNNDNKILRFGWVIVDSKKRGAGYGSEMLKLGLKYAFEILLVEKVTIGVFENNPIAHNCYKRIGFKNIKIVNGDSFNIIEMEITKEDYFKK